MLYWVQEFKHCITWPVVNAFFMKPEGSSRENQSSAEGIYGDANSDTRYNKGAFNRRCTVSKNTKYPRKTKQIIRQSHNKCEYQQKRPYQVNKALSLIQDQLHRSPVTSKCLQANERSSQRWTVKIHLISPVVLVRWNVEGNKLPNSLQLASYCSYTWKCINLFYFRQTSWLSPPSVWW